MANAFYDFGRQGFAEGAVNWLTDDIRVALISNVYTPDLAAHQYLSDIGANVLGTAQALASKTTTSPVGGVLDAADAYFTAVTSGDTVRYVLIYRNTGVAATSRLLFLFDTATGLPVLTNGGDISVVWDSGVNRIARL